MIEVEEGEVVDSTLIIDSLTMISVKGGGAFDETDEEEEIVA